MSNVKVAIFDQLKKFDEYFKKIALAKEANTLDPAEKGKVQAEIAGIGLTIEKIKDELAAEERIVYNILSENPDRIKQLEKQHAKIGKLKATITEYEENITNLVSRIDEIEKQEAIAGELSTLQENYKKCLSNLMNLRARFTQEYDECERESGIHFLSGV